MTVGHYLELPGARVIQTAELLLAGRCAGDLLAARAMGVLHGPAGSGKTFAAHVALAELRVATAWVHDAAAELLARVDDPLCARLLPRVGELHARRPRPLPRAARPRADGGDRARCSSCTPAAASTRRHEAARADRPSSPRAAERLLPLAQNWLHAERTRHLVIRRADRRPASEWSALRDLCAGVDAPTLWLIVHRPQLSRDEHVALRGTRRSDMSVEELAHLLQPAPEPRVDDVQDPASSRPSLTSTSRSSRAPAPSFCPSRPRAARSTRSGRAAG